MDAMTHIGSGDDDDTTTGFGFGVSNVDVSSLDFTGVTDVQTTNDGSIYTDLGGLLSTSNGGTYNYQVLQQANGLSLGVYTVQSLEIPSNAVIRVSGTNGLVIVAAGDIHVDGRLLGSSHFEGGYTGPGAGDDSTPGDRGAGTGGGGAGGPTKPGAGGSFCGMGGAGGGMDGAPSSTPGATYGTPELSPLVAGSQGGNGKLGSGGKGGGAIQLVAGGTITVDGVIDVGGEGGDPVGVYNTGNSQTASGGGTGGAVLLEAHDVSIAGTISANGGGGGGDGYGTDANASSEPAPGGAAGTEALAGGNGAAGSTIAGGSTPAAVTANGGGGGGGAGRIRFNTRTGTASITGTLSPSATTACVSQGVTAPGS